MQSTMHPPSHRHLILDGQQSPSTPRMLNVREKDTMQATHHLMPSLERSASGLWLTSFLYRNLERFRGIPWRLAMWSFHLGSRKTDIWFTIGKMSAKWLTLMNDQCALWEFVQAKRVSHELGTGYVPKGASLVKSRLEATKGEWASGRRNT